MTLVAVKKTFSGRGGRPRSPGLREPSGRLQRLHDNESRARKREVVTAVVLAQPHRKGSSDRRRVWPISRLILDGKVAHSRYEPSVLERAAELYSKDYAQLRWTIDSRRPYWTGSGGGGEPATEEDKYAAETAWSDVRRALMECGERVLKAMDAVVLDAHPDFDERTYAPWIILSLPQGLATLAEHYGLV